jgi:hypothetical protein
MGEVVVNNSVGVPEPRKKRDKSSIVELKNQSKGRLGRSHFTVQSEEIVEVLP